MGDKAKRPVKSEFEANDVNKLIEMLVQHGYTLEEAQEIAENPVNSSKFKCKIMQDVDTEEITDLVNSDEVLEDPEENFTDASEELSGDEVVDALGAIDAIAAAVLEAQGEEPTEATYEEVLDVIDEVTAPLGDDIEEIPDEIASSVINLHVADAEGNDAEVTVVPGDDSSFDVVTGVDETEDAFEDVPAEDETEASTDLVVTSSKKYNAEKITSRRVRINSHWKDVDALHKKAWDEAEKRVKEQGLTPEAGSRYYGQVMAIAKAYYNKHFKDNNVWEEAGELGSSLRRVVSALKKYKIKSSEDIEGANPPKPEDSEGTDGDASMIQDEGLGADGKGTDSGEIEGGSNAKQETPGLGDPVDFQNPETEEYELPDAEGNRALMTFTEVSNSLSIASSEVSPSVADHVHGRVLKQSDGSKVLFLKSNIFGLVAVKGAFQQGIKNARYTAFAYANGKYIASGKEFDSANKGNFIIASVSSLRGLKDSKSNFEVVSALESAYVEHLKSSRAEAEGKLVEEQSVSSYYKKVAERRAAIAQQQMKKHSSQLNSSLEDYKTKVAQEQFERDLIAQEKEIAASDTSRIQSLNSNIEYLSRIM